MIFINHNIHIDENKIQLNFIRASGPGGQNVNKVATAVQLRFDATSLPELVFTRLQKIAGKRLTSHGELIITAQRFRTQEKNRQDALQRLVELIRKATIVPKKRRATKPSLAAKKRRLENKRRHSAIKKRRRPISDQE